MSNAITAGRGPCQRKESFTNKNVNETERINKPRDNNQTPEAEVKLSTGI